MDSSGLSHDSHRNSTLRSYRGCWTCRLRRKKCDERYPICDICSGLLISCHYDDNKPEWMDGGVKQEEMAARLKRQVKEMAHLRQKLPKDQSPPSNRNQELDLLPEPSPGLLARGPDCRFTRKNQSITLGRDDTILLSSFLEHVFPFLFPFYHPPILDGGKAWVLEMTMSSPVVRQICLCQSSVFLYLAGDQGTGNTSWETILSQTWEVFGVLSQSLQVLSGSNINEHLHGAVRVVASIMQVLHFEIAVLSFENCLTHLNGALNIFEQLLHVPDVLNPKSYSVIFNILVDLVGPPAHISSVPDLSIPSAEQAAFRFSAGLLIFDDIIASTVRKQQPRLYRYHGGLLDRMNDITPPFDLEEIMGCQNWVVRQLGEIATLEAWKQERKEAGDLDVMEMVHRAQSIKELLVAQLMRLEIETQTSSNESSSLLKVLNPSYQYLHDVTGRNSLITRLWAHATLLYLAIVVSGWQPASANVRSHISSIITLLTQANVPSLWLRTVVWPFCVAGCLAEPEQECKFRALAAASQPVCVFKTVHKALEIMETVWGLRGASDTASWDLATFFSMQRDFILLV